LIVSEGVVVGVADTANGPHRAHRGETLGVADLGVLGTRKKLFEEPLARERAERDEGGESDPVVARAVSAKFEVAD